MDSMSFLDSFCEKDLVPFGSFCKKICVIPVTLSGISYRGFGFSSGGKRQTRWNVNSL